LRSLLATAPGELLIPDYDAARESAGEINADTLERFHAAHRGHKLAEVIVGTVGK
jgi:hypothetical protein